MERFRGTKLGRALVAGATTAVAATSIGGLGMQSAEAAIVAPHSSAIEHVISDNASIIPEASIHRRVLRNYAGYVEQSKATHVKGEFTVPKVTCPDSKRKRTGIWIGETNTTKPNTGEIWQGGIVIKCNGKHKPAYVVFEQLFPQQKDGLELPITVNAGDRLEVNLRHPHSTEFDMHITNVTTGAQTVDSQTLDPNRRFTTRFAEGILEDPTLRGVFVPLARTTPSTIRFLVSGGHGPGYYADRRRLTKDKMEKNGKTIAHAGPITRNGRYLLHRG